MRKSIAAMAALVGVAVLGGFVVAGKQGSGRAVTRRWVAQFAPVGVVERQILRLNVVNAGLVPPIDPELPPSPITPGDVAPPDSELPPGPTQPGGQLPPGPIHVIAMIYSAADPKDGFRFEADLKPGESISWDLDPVKLKRFDRRVELRADVFTYMSGRRGAGSPAGPVRSSLEVMESDGFRTSIHCVPAVQSELSPVR